MTIKPMTNVLESFKNSEYQLILSQIEDYPWQLRQEALDYFEELQITKYGSHYIMNSMPPVLSYKHRIFDLNMYIEFRMHDRSKDWPASLSKKEIALCKINMVKTLYYLHVNADLTQSKPDVITDYVASILEHIETSVYNWKWNPEKPTEKWPGLDPHAALILNTLYKSFKKSKHVY